MRYLLIALLLFIPSCASPSASIREGVTEVHAYSSDALVALGHLDGHVEDGFEEYRETAVDSVEAIQSTLVEKVDTQVTLIEDKPDFFANITKILKWIAFSVLGLGILVLMAEARVFPLMGGLLRLLSSWGISMIPKAKDEAKLLMDLQTAAEASGDSPTLQKMHALVAHRRTGSTFDGQWEREKKRKLKQHLAQTKDQDVKPI